MSDQVLFEIARELELQDLLRFVSVCSSLRRLCFDSQVWKRHFVHGELQGEEVRSIHDYVGLATRCLQAKLETEKFLYKFWIAYPRTSERWTSKNLANKPINSILNIEREIDTKHHVYLFFKVTGERRVRCRVKDSTLETVYRESMNEEKVRLLFYKIRLYDAIHPNFYEQVEIGYQYNRKEVLNRCIIGAFAKSDKGDESWCDEYTCTSCGKSISEGEEEMSYQSKAILCPSCLKKELARWAERFVKEFIMSNKEYVFVDKSDRERAFLYQEAEKQKVKFAKFTAWDRVMICSEHGTRTRAIGRKDVCVQGKLEDEKFLCQHNLVRSKVRKMVLYKGQARDRMGWRELYEA